MAEFDDIRPYEDNEVQGVIRRLIADDELLLFLARYQLPGLTRWFPGLMKLMISRGLRKQLGGVDSISEFQDVVSHYAHRIVRETVTEFHHEGLDALEPDKPCLFVSNHRDIAADSMFVNYARYLSGYQTVRIAVGDNLIQREFATDLMKLNKSFFIKRSEKGSRRMYEGLLKSSKFIHQSLQGGHCVWIAQREGRAKDGWDRTDPAIIKMFALADRKENLSTIVRNLNIVPVAIAYEFDPCDQLKAGELKAIEEHGHYEKPPGEDLVSLAKGLGGFKGRVHLRFGQPLAGDFESPDDVAAEIDRQILDNLQLFPVNYWALSKIPEPPFQDVYEQRREDVQVEALETETARRRYEECSEELRPFWLRMYANPVVNKHRNNAARLEPV